MYSVIGKGNVGNVKLIRIGVSRDNHWNHIKIVLAGKIQISLVVCGATIYCARAILHKDKISDKDGNCFAVNKWMFGVKTGIVSFLLRLFQGSFCCPDGSTFCDKSRELGIVCRQLGGKRVVGRNGAKGGTKNCVMARGENLQPVLSTLQFKPYLHAFRTTDPVFLHHPHFGGPALELFEVL